MGKGGVLLSGDVLGRPDQVHSEGPGFADNGADSTAPALPGIDDSLQLLGTFYLAHLDCVKLAPLQAVLTSYAEVCIDSGFVAALGKDCIVGHTADVGGVPDSTAAAAAATQGIGLSSFDFRVVHPLMDKSFVLIPVNDG
jgi:hypothetical protein